MVCNNYIRYWILQLSSDMASCNKVCIKSQCILYMYNYMYKYIYNVIVVLSETVTDLGPDSETAKCKFVDCMDDAVSIFRYLKEFSVGKACF